MLRKYFYASTILCLSSIVWADTPASSPLTMGHGAWIYDYDYSGDPSTTTKTPQQGQWKTELSNFNSKASQNNKITRLYPYASELLITCNNGCASGGPPPTNVSQCTINSGYEDGTNGPLTVKQYKAKVPNTYIMPVIDWTPNEQDNSVLMGPTKNCKVSQDVTNQLVTLAAQKISTKICSDSNVDGVLMDLEGVNIFGKTSLVSLLTQISTGLAKCNKYMGMYNDLKSIDWSQLTTINSNNNFFVGIPFYDMTGNPHDDINDYTHSVNGAIQTLFANATTPFTIIAPIGASSQSYQQTGTYQDSQGSDPAYYHFPTSTPVLNRQIQYFQAVQSAVCTQASTYFIGIDYWSWQEYIKGQTGYINAPNLPDTPTVQYFQQSANICPNTEKPSVWGGASKK